MGSYLRFHRKKTGLSQNELAEIVGTIGLRQVARHERAESVPSFIVAIGYRVALNAALTELFPGIYEVVQHQIQQRLISLEQRLEQSSPKGRKLEETATKLVWLKERIRELNAQLANEKQED